MKCVVFRELSPYVLLNSSTTNTVLLYPHRDAQSEYSPYRQMKVVSDDITIKMILTQAAPLLFYSAHSINSSFGTTILLPI